jgi:hypothetical protein
MAFASGFFRLKPELANQIDGRFLRYAPRTSWLELTMNRILAAVLLIAVACVTPGAARAQGYGQGAPGEMKGGRGHKGANDFKKEDAKPKVDERAYKEALQKIPDSKEKYDPWGSVRSDNPKPKLPAKLPAK